MDFNWGTQVCCLSIVVICVICGPDREAAIHIVYAVSPVADFHWFYGPRGQALKKHSCLVGEGILDNLKLGSKPIFGIHYRIIFCSNFLVCWSALTENFWIDLIQP